MSKWKLWFLTIALFLVSGVFLMWAVQTAWLGSFPNKNKSIYSFWAILQMGGALIAFMIPVLLWVKKWKRMKFSGESTEEDVKNIS